MTRDPSKIRQFVYLKKHKTVQNSLHFRDILLNKDLKIHSCQIDFAQKYDESQSSYVKFWSILIAGLW